MTQSLAQGKRAGRLTAEDRAELRSNYFLTKRRVYFGIRTIQAGCVSATRHLDLDARRFGADQTTELRRRPSDAPLVWPAEDSKTLVGSVGWCPPNTQLRPLPLQWDTSLIDPPNLPPQSHYSSLYRSQFIPDIHIGTAEDVEALWADRKTLFKVWNARIRGRQTESIDAPEIPFACARCGASAFMKEDVCRDCGMDMSRWSRKLPSLEEESQTAEQPLRHESLSPSIRGQEKHTRKGRRRRERISPERFLAGLIVSRWNSLEYLTNPKELTKAANTMRLLCGELDLFSRDVAAETGEPVSTLDERCGTILKALKEYAQKGLPLPTIHPAEAGLLALIYPTIFVRVRPELGGDHMLLVEEFANKAPS